MAVITVKFFGTVGDLASASGSTFELSNDGTFGDLVTALRVRYGRRFEETLLSSDGALRGHVKLFLNDELVKGNRPRDIRLFSECAASEVVLYVVPAIAGG